MSRQQEMEPFGGAAQMRYLLRNLLFLSIWPSLALGAPDTTMSITPAAVSSTTINAANENTRNNNISTPYNSHSHTDISTTSANTLNLGDGLAGNKNLCANAADGTDSCLRWDDTANVWMADQPVAGTFVMLGNPIWVTTTSLSLNLTSQGDVAFTDLDLTSVTSATARTVILYVLSANSAVGVYTINKFRRNGDTPASTATCTEQDALSGVGSTNEVHCTVIVGMDSGQIIEYDINIESGTTGSLDVAVLGYW